jgi:hypothetical protein
MLTATWVKVMKAMIFDHKSGHEITDEEIDLLVQDHVQERQHLEFKATVNLKSDEEKHEILRDIASLANGGGGYLIIGIRDDGKGRAQTYASDLKLDAERVKKVVMDLSNKYVSERLHGLEVATRSVKSHPVVIVRIPNSEQTPHMVTYNDTTGFYRRYHDGKRSMTTGEIRDAFSQYSLGQSHDGTVFQESDEILDIAVLEDLLEALEGDAAYGPDERQLISDYCEFLKDGKNRYVHRDIRATSAALTDSLTELLSFFDANYHGPDRQGEYCLSIYPESGVDLAMEELSRKDERKYEKLEKQLKKLTAAVWTNYEKYRRTVKSVLLM